MNSLDQLVESVKTLQSKLIFIVGSDLSARAKSLGDFGNRKDIQVFKVGMSLANELASVPISRRPLQANAILRKLVQEYAKSDLLLVDNIELLFDQTLMLDPVDVLKSHAHSTRLVAVWPGNLVGGRLTYAQMGHPEYRDYPTDGVILFDIETKN